jgi:hypothetical protein
MVCSVFVVVWHYECHLAEELACSILQYYLELMTKLSMQVSILSGSVDELRLVEGVQVSSPLSEEELTIPLVAMFC